MGQFQIEPLPTFADFEFGLAQAESRIFLTRDSGRTWIYNAALSSVLAPYQSLIMRRALYQRERSLWFIAEVGDGSVLHSRDNGNNWRFVSRQ